MRAQSRREAQQRRSRMRPSLGRSGLTANFLEDRGDDSGTFNDFAIFFSSVFDLLDEHFFFL